MRKHRFTLVTLGCSLCLFAGLGAEYDLIIRSGLIYDGSGKTPMPGSIAINGDKIAATGQLEGAHGKRELDAGGLAGAPGLINMLSWATESLIAHGRAQRGIRQGM